MMLRDRWSRPGEKRHATKIPSGFNISYYPDDERRPNGIFLHRLAWSPVDESFEASVLAPAGDRALTHDLRDGVQVEWLPYQILGRYDSPWSSLASSRKTVLNELSQLGVGAGISTRLSFQVAIAFLIIFTARRTQRGPRMAAAQYRTLVRIGSVHLGWHCIIDGSVGIAGGMAWCLVDRMLDHDLEFADGPTAESA